VTTLYAGPHIGEFGWELFCWQGFLRRQSKSYDQTIVACQRGREILYRDFAKTISLDLNITNQHCWQGQCKDLPSPSEIFGTEPSQGDCYYQSNYWHVVYPPSNVNSAFNEQDFIKFGTATLGYRYLIHARNRQHEANRNGSDQLWEVVKSITSGHSTATIGTLSDSKYIAGDDLRGLPLEDLVNVMASSQTLIGPSSGPIHLAALCGLPTLTWFGEPYPPANAKRFTHDWNPFKTPAAVIYSPSWEPAAEELEAALLYKFRRSNAKPRRSRGRKNKMPKH
jgi:hypothetical protein